MIVGLEGGMGNQLFQLAFGKSLAKRRGEEVAFTRWRLDNDPNGRRYELDHFKAEVKIVEREEPPITQDTWYFNPDPQGRSFTGHWQSEKYFDEPIVRTAIKFKDEMKGFSAETYEVACNIGEDYPTCGIHVRRGDYTLPDRIAYHGNVSMGYYLRAMDYIRSNAYRGGRIRFYIFSDDPGWCRDKFPNCRIVDHNQNRAHEDLWLISRCSHAIIPNSTFGWWGAWLGYAHPDRIVIAPERWFACGLNSSDVVPERWLKMEN